MTGWIFAPLLGVGPLLFGMTHDEVVAALGDAVAGPIHAERLWLTLSEGKTVTRTRFAAVGVTVYYADGLLYCVAVDALGGLQVSLDGLELIGEVPSKIEAQIWEYAQSRALRGAFSPSGCAYLPEIGLIPGRQVVNGVLVSRALFAGKPDFDVWHDMPPSFQDF